MIGTCLPADGPTEFAAFTLLNLEHAEGFAIGLPTDQRPILVQDLLSAFVTTGALSYSEGDGSIYVPSHGYHSR